MLLRLRRHIIARLAGCGAIAALGLAFAPPMLHASARGHVDCAPTQQSTAPQHGHGMAMPSAHIAPAQGGQASVTAPPAACPHCLAAVCVPGTPCASDAAGLTARPTTQNVRADGAPRLAADVGHIHSRTVTPLTPPPNTLL